MSRRARGFGQKRQREQQVQQEKKEMSALMQVTAHAEPLTLLAVVKLAQDTLVLLQLCNPKGVALFSFIRLPSHVPRPFAGAPVYSMPLTHAERRRVVGSVFKGKLVRLLSLGVGPQFEPQRNWNNCRKMMQFNVRRVAAGLAAALRDNVAKEAEELCASGQCAAALVLLQRAIDWGHLPSRALKAWLHIDGREGVAENQHTAFALAEEGARFGCHHCQGVMAYCLGTGTGTGRGSSARPDAYVVDEARALELARKSAADGSRYGQHTLGKLLEDAHDYPQALLQYRLAAAQGLDDAQCQLGRMYECSLGVAEDYVEALRLYHLAAAQGLPEALHNVAVCHQLGAGCPVNLVAARSWYMRAQAAGHHLSSTGLRHLDAGVYSSILSDDDLRTLSVTVPPPSFPSQ